MDAREQERGDGQRRSVGRLAVGLVGFAADRLKVTGLPGSGALVTALGVAVEADAAARRRTREAADAVRRRGVEAADAVRTVVGTVDRFAPRPQFLTTRAQWGADAVRYRLDRARRAGDTVVRESRADAEKYVADRVGELLGWTGRQVVPVLLDGAVPQLVDDVVPRILDGVLPRVRDRVVPIIIDDLTRDPSVRDLVREQSRGIVSAAAEQVRDATGLADDRIESGLRRLFGGRP
ncbi:hypothetical protein [Actinocatenispora rupis]|uniref:Uncharacterized protein n=1 Tax=Actinocatenispora rupis TaxID=519421 RepID=A0A8J3NDM6_9ACTN|nr:hypothetical protein [Actinocatenispora rupis]GID15469.1 hypothetical protein Aru02nite_63580 [Actinocatenispora rupis]